MVQGSEWSVEARTDDSPSVRLDSHSTEVMRGVQGYVCMVWAKRQ